MKTRRHQKFAADGEALVALAVPLPPAEDAWHDYTAEALWAEELGEGRYLLRSAPFLAFELAVEDVVTASVIDGVLTFGAVVERGGGSTYRVHSPAGIESQAARLEALEELDVTAELDGEWAALDVPSHADLEEVYALLVDGEEAGAWSFEEGWAAS